MKPQHHPLAGQFHALAALLELKLNRRRKQVAQNTVECDGIKLQCYNQSPEKSNPIKRKNIFFKVDGFSLSEWRLHALVHGRYNAYHHQISTLPFLQKKAKGPSFHRFYCHRSNTVVSSETPEGANKKSSFQYVQYVNPMMTKGREMLGKKNGFHWGPQLSGSGAIHLLAEMRHP